MKKQKKITIKTGLYHASTELLIWTAIKSFYSEYFVQQAYL